MVMQTAKLFIPLICYNRSCHTDYMMSILRLYDYIKSKGMAATFYPIFWDSLVSRARNAAASEFLYGDHTHLLFIDADISFEPSDVEKLLEADKDVVCVPYPKKYIKYESVKENKELVDFAVGGKYNQVSENLYEIESVATGFLMIKKNVLRQIIRKYPNIEYINDIDKEHFVFRINIELSNMIIMIPYFSFHYMD